VVGSPLTQRSKLLRCGRRLKKVNIPLLPLRLAFVALPIFPPWGSFTFTAGVRGQITRFVVTIPTTSVTYHVYELDVSHLVDEYSESKERNREWVDYHEAIKRLRWKPELVQGIQLSSIAPKR
jgi:hypothetical protein